MGWPAVVVLLATFWGLATSSVMEKCNTFDEMAHLVSGYSYLAMSDFRLNPANINLSQILAALPLLWSDVHFPSLDQPAWRENPHPPNMGFQFFYLSGNDIQPLLWRARAMIALAGCILGLVIYLWARQLFGPVGGLISLTMFAFCPPLLANGSLVTTDLMVSLTFLLASWCFWNMLQKVTVRTVLCSGFAIAALMLSKLTGLFFVPMALGLIIIRLAAHRPLTVKMFRTWHVSSQAGQIGVLLGSILVQAMIVVATIWAAFGFRYSSYNPRLGDYTYRGALWERALARPGFVSDCFVFARDHRLLPEAYLYSLAAMQSDVQTRKAFLNGQYSYHGWRRFFPYAFVVKTPLTLLAVVVLSAAAAAVKWRRTAREKKEKTEKKGWTIPAKEALYTTAPLWMLLGVYWLWAITSSLNIGHRHILPTYPPLLVLAGGAAYWLTTKSKAVGAVVIAALLALAAESVYRWPNYIAYFNQLTGGPANGYKHLVDSSLDWGQDLPSLKRWLEQQNLENQTRTPIYLCYFGTASPTYFGIRARRLPGYIDLDVPDLQLPPVVGGVYCISATMLQSVVQEPMGPWTAGQEQRYQSAANLVMPLLKMGSQKINEILGGPSGQDYRNELMVFNLLRQKRMMAYLRQREPIHQVNHTILIYRLSDQEAAEALTGPPPELLDFTLTK
jgi:4-amino-4-deoxy-L-arabinose transferase-like glycosyltransferase